MPQGMARRRHERRLSVLPLRPPTELADGFGLGRRRRPIPAHRRTGAPGIHPSAAVGPRLALHTWLAWSSDSAVAAEATQDQVTTTRPTGSHRTGVMQL